MIVLCALIEVWARKNVVRREKLVGAYSKGGVLLRGKKTTNAGEVFFGRYLCGDSLVHEEQVALLRHLQKRNAGSVRELHEVMSCLTNAGIVPSHSGLLHALATNDEWNEVVLDDPPADLVFVEEVMRAKKSSFGRRFV